MLGYDSFWNIKNFKFLPNQRCSGKLLIWPRGKMYREQSVHEMKYLAVKRHRVKWPWIETPEERNVLGRREDAFGVTRPSPALSME
jgi:hypothetical protein